MEAGERARPHDLTHLARLAADPRRVHILHALRVIEASYPEAPRLGQSRRPREDKVRLGQVAELAFPPSTIASFTAPTDAKPGVLKNHFFGLFGPQGPLPLTLTEYARDRQRNHRDGTFVAFADMLTHRLLSLFYRAWASAEPAPSYDRPDNDPFADKVAAISGLMGMDFADRDDMPDDAKRHFSGHLALSCRPAEGLISIVSGFFEAPVEIEEWVGSWLELSDDDQWSLGSSMGLGQTTSVGSRVWSRNAKFRLKVGPLTLAQYKRLLPGSGSMERLEALVRNYVGDWLDWDVQLILKADEVPEAKLGEDSPLGQVSWIGARPPDQGDAGDLYLVPSLRATYLPEGYPHE